MRRTHLLSALFLPPALLCAVAAAQTTAGLPGVEWDELTKAIREIESAAKVDDTMAAYARGCTQNRQNVKLQRAYLLRMLKFGRPDVAYYPAKELTTLDPRDGVAWGVLAYRSAIGNQYIAALPNALKAVTFEPDNESICQNAAQLLVWYEGGQRSPVSSEVKGLITKVKGGSDSKRFSADYRKAKAEFSKLGDEQAKKKKEADAADNEAQQSERKYEQFRDKLRTQGKTYDAEQRKLERLRDDLRRADDQVNSSRDYRQRQSAERRRDTVARSIRDSQDTLRKYLRDGKKTRDEMEKAEKEFKGKKEHVARLLREAGAVGEGMPSSFTWQPPAVDGVITPDATLTSPKGTPRGRNAAQPKDSYLAPDRPKATPDAPQPSLNEMVAEAEAADKLGLAKICTDSKDDAMKAKAKELLREVITKYPTTKAAAEAKTLLEKLP